jgi:RNase P/RNase MRP subunit p29
MCSYRKLPPNCAVKSRQTKTTLSTRSAIPSDLIGLTAAVAVEDVEEAFVEIEEGSVVIEEAEEVETSTADHRVETRDHRLRK